MYMHESEQSNLENTLSHLCVQASLFVRKLEIKL